MALNNTEQHYPFLLSVGTLLLAQELTRLERKKKHRQKMERVLIKKQELLCEAFPEDIADFIVQGEGFIITKNLEDALRFNWPNDQALTFIIDLAFTNPFAPYELSFSDKHFSQALAKIGLLVGVESKEVANVQQTQKDAIKAHRQIAWGKIVAYGLGGMLVLGVGGWLFAPAIGGAIGSAAGLYGAAATSHGLAILGGGSLAIGGLGMAGGMWVVVGAGATMGLLSTGGATLLLELGAARARVELIKFQVNYKEVVLGGQVQIKKAQEIIKSLSQQRDEIKQKLAEERNLNDKNSARLKDIEATLEAMEQALKWAEAKYNQAKQEQSTGNGSDASALSKGMLNEH